MQYELCNVTHRFGNCRAAVSGVDLLIKSNEVVALLGKSGAGKSTIVSMLCRDFDPDEGVILLNGHPLGDYNLNSIQQYQACISQDEPTPSGTVRDALRFGLPNHLREQITDADMVAMIKTVSPALLDRLTDGLDEVVGDKGTKLSGGQRQRLSIVRALLMRPRTIFIDEATSALDSTTEKEVQAGLDCIFECGVTVVIIAHRLSTLRKCTKFVYLTDGKIATITNTLEELCAQNTEFAQMYRDQKLGLA